MERACSKSRRKPLVVMFARLLAWARWARVLLWAPVMETYSILSMVILRVGLPPRCSIQAIKQWLCQHSKNKRKHLINMNLKNKKGSKRSLSNASAAYFCRLQQARACRRQHLSTQVDNGLGYRTFGFNGLGVGLVVALRHDQVDQLIRQFDVGVLQGTGLQSTQGAAARGSAYRLTRLEGLHPGSFAHRRQALHVGKVGQNHLPLHL